jgi:TonB family protein
LKKARHEVERYTCSSSSTETGRQSSQKSLIQAGKTSGFYTVVSITLSLEPAIAHHFLSMSRRLRLLVLAMTVISQRTSFAAADVKQRTADGRALSEEQTRALATYTPLPQYPSAARAKHLQGAGMVRLDVDERTGYVTSTRMLQSTGHQILDDEALRAFRAWRFKPESVSVVRIPVRFVMTGRQHWPQTVDPKYPGEARDTGLTGRGVAKVKVDPRTGYVTSAWMLKSTGHQILDNAAMEAFRQWRFRPKTVTSAEIPVQFTMKGVFYHTRW